MAHHPLAVQLPLSTGLKADKGIELLTWGTPNGFKASILLEELKEAYGKDYSVQAIALPKGVQKQPWYLALNPSGKIPVIVDHDNGGVSVCESGAILQYLVREHDPEHKFSFTEPAEVAKAEQWIHFMQGDMSPTGGNSIRFFRFFPEKHSFPLQLFHREGLKVLDVLDKALEGRDYLVGTGRGKFSYADIGCFPYVNNSCFVGWGPLERWPNVHRWQQRIWARPAVKRGVDTPYPALSTNESYEKKMAEDPEFAAAEKKLNEVLEKALAEFPPFGPPK
ncbi:uncharacterized protein PV09_07930 [Verruconis gallopava]|uniref:Glutathione S-transferase n=1 Tax=Verruconis gallopava TaxID=253628 RepID=A0A0D1YIB5_9PEZI|nr:uncharacterized protein PV09_07930 [Verruconis gallopava]KIW00577.1 hypothetical protein PV09_07930 [Verruconis gallopava]